MIVIEEPYFSVFHLAKNVTSDLKGMSFDLLSEETCFPASILYKSTAGRYRPVSYPDGPITARYRFIKNAYWVVSLPFVQNTNCNLTQSKMVAFHVGNANFLSHSNILEHFEPAHSTISATTYVDNNDTDQTAYIHLKTGLFVYCRQFKSRLLLSG